MNGGVAEIRRSEEWQGWQRDVAEGRGRGTWQRDVAEGRGRGTWQRDVAEGHGRGTWQRVVAEGHGRGTWQLFGRLGRWSSKQGRKVE